MSTTYTAEQFRRDSVYVVRKLAREISQHRSDPVELGFDLEEMREHAIRNRDPFVRDVAVRYLQRHQFGPSRDPRRTRSSEDEE